MKNKKLLSILTTIAVVAGCLPGFVLADNDVVDAETNTEVTEETNSAEEPQLESYEVDESIASDTPAYANDTEELVITYISRAWDSVNSLVTEEEVTLTLGEGERLYTVAELNEITYTPESGWCYVDSESELTCRFAVTANKTLNIILADGVTLDCPSGIFVEVGAILNVYGQHNDSGVLNANGVNGAGIGANGGSSIINAGAVNIYGGCVNATGGAPFAGIGGGMLATAESVSIYGGTVTTTGFVGIGALTTTKPFTVNIYGGDITATGINGGADIGSCAGMNPDSSSFNGIVNICGGSITLPGAYGAYIGHGNSGIEDGELNISVGMCVAKAGDPVLADERVSTCTSEGSEPISIYPCQHSQYTDGVCDFCGFTVGESAQFIGHAMRLTGEIGLQFYVKLPTDSAEGYYMTFEGQGMDPANPVELVADSAKTGVENSFYALINMNSIQMAESFIPTLHCPDGTFIQGSAYSAQDYIAWGKDNRSIDSNDRGIIRALGDYGYFAQRYLSSLRSWSLGTDYAAMTVRGSDEDYSKRYDTFREWIAEHATSGFFNSNNGYFASATFNLKFDSLVTMYVYLTPIDGVSIDTSLIIQGYSVEQLSDGRILITFPDLPIDALDNIIHINYGDTPVVEISPLTYVYTAIGSSSSMSPDGKNMVCALFRLFAGVVYPTTG